MENERRKVPSCNGRAMKGDDYDRLIVILINCSFM